MSEQWTLETQTLMAWVAFLSVRCLWIVFDMPRILCHVPWGSQSKCHPVNSAHWSISQFTVFVDCLWHDLESPCHRGFSGRVSHGQSVTRPQCDHQSITFILKKFIFVQILIWRNSRIVLWHWNVLLLIWRPRKDKRTLRKYELVITLFKILIKF